MITRWFYCKGERTSRGICKQQPQARATGSWVQKRRRLNGTDHRLDYRSTRRKSGLAVAATSPRQAATSAAADRTSYAACATSAGPKPDATSAAAASPKAAGPPKATAATAASTPATSPTAASDKLHTRSKCCGVFFVEYIECRQANVGDFLLSENDFVAQRAISWRNIRCRCTGCTARQRQRQTNSAQYWDRLPPPLLL